MAFGPLVWYCRPVTNGVWAKLVDNAFGVYTPCATDTLVISISHLILLSLCFYRIWRIKKDFKVQRFCLRSNYYNYMLALLAGYCTAEPLFRLIMGISVFNLDGQAGLAPFEDDCDSVRLKAGVYYCNTGYGIWANVKCFSVLQVQLVISYSPLLCLFHKDKVVNDTSVNHGMLETGGATSLKSKEEARDKEKYEVVIEGQVVSLIIKAFAWCSMLVLIGIETKVYIREFRWYLRFGVLYTLVGEAVMLNLILSVKELYDRTSCTAAFSGVPLSVLQLNWTAVCVSKV
ncbi:ABC transporter C family member 2 [Vitis vinifera]|uniref:ABC transporter C family member 2 n=1 Tax=Vitis vinifera TaxID=29760 RepID=A0A438IP97_VITVI|nr:ABC transporter C family member 2 [Vitis vinifera]